VLIQFFVETKAFILCWAAKKRSALAMFLLCSIVGFAMVSLPFIVRVE